jgi:hypothetical protein
MWSVSSRYFTGRSPRPIARPSGSFDPPPRLTRQEERAGLLGETATIGTRAGWADRLSSMGYAVRDHRLVRCQSEVEPARARANDDAGF